MNPPRTRGTGPAGSPPSGRPPAARGASIGRSAPPLALPPGIDFRHPLTWVAIAVAVVGIVLSVSNRIEDTDFWQHLVVGRAIAQLHRVPTTQLWTWPTYGAPDVNYAWGFEALIWPVWKMGGLFGLFVWRWCTTLAAFGILWLAARRMGARGYTPLFVLVVCSLVYRQRSDIRPETLIAILFAIEVWILETRRHGGRDRSWALLLIAWVWANVHISYVFGLAYLGLHTLDAQFARRPLLPGTPRHGAKPLWLACVGWVLVSTITPFGWKVLLQPFEYFFVWRHEPIYLTIGEMHGIDWGYALRNGTLLLLVGWPLLVLLRATRRGFDFVEASTCALFVGLSFSSQRFLGNLSLAAAAYLSCDFDQLLAALRRPAWTLAPAARSALTASACVLVGLPLWTFPTQPVTIDAQWQFYPEKACDFIADHGIRGHAFNHFQIGGYMLYRFWPERDRLPFIDVHQAGTRDDRLRYQRALETEQAWKSARDHYDIDYVLLYATPVPGEVIHEVLDRDTTFSLVFMDDAAVLFVRRGRFAPIARDYGYRLLQAGRTHLGELGRRCATDSLLRREVSAELERVARSSPRNAVAHSLLANLALIDNDLALARSHLEHSLALDRTFSSAHQRLGYILLQQGRPREALEEYRRERALELKGRTMDLEMGIAWQRLGDLHQARAAYRRALAVDAGNEEARDSLAALDARIR